MRGFRVVVVGMVVAAAAGSGAGVAGQTADSRAALRNDTHAAPLPARLHAYDATDVTREIYWSEQNSARDRAGMTVRFAIPTVADGRVFVGARSEVDVYGLVGR